MITLSQALEWLNQLDQTHLSPGTEEAIRKITDAHMTSTEKDRSIDSLVYNSRSSQDVLETAEVFVICAKIQAERNRLPHSLILLDYARTLYDQKRDHFRLAVVLWMMSIIEWKMLENNAGHAHARSSRNLMEQLGRETNPQKKDNRAWWIQERLKDMDEDLIRTPEEAYFWLNQFEGTHLKPASIQICDAINAAVREKQFNRVYNLISTLLETNRNSSDPFETAEVKAFCGLVNYQMGNTPDAIRLLRQSIAAFLPESHHQTTVRWMLGMVQFSQPLNIGNAINTCNQCIASMDQLKDRAERRNHLQAKIWYETRAALMRKVLTKNIHTLEKAI